MSTYEPHACVIVYSVVQRSSFHVAEEILNYLWRENISKEKAVILVGNKADLARSRVISTADGKQLAQSRDAKFIETSSGIQHNVDELLVGVLKQVSVGKIDWFFEKENKKVLCMMFYIQFLCYRYVSRRHVKRKRNKVLVKCGIQRHTSPYI